jgi:hypothetical protein
MFTIGSNVPGYLPDDDPVVVLSWSQALEVFNEMLEQELEALAGSYGSDSKVFKAAEERAGEAMKNGDHDVTLPTSDSPHDLGRYFWID